MKLQVTLLAQQKDYLMSFSVNWSGSWP